MFFGRPRKRALRIYFATDIHGSDRCFRKFLAAAESYEADALVLGGDIAGKGLVPIRSHNGTLSAKVRGEAVRTAERSWVGALAPAAAGLSKLDSMRRAANGSPTGQVDVLGAGAQGVGGILRCSLERR